MLFLEPSRYGWPFEPTIWVDIHLLIVTLEMFQDVNPHPPDM